MNIDFNFNNELSGKIALVTGGTKGTGKAIAERLVKAGAKVIVTARNKPDNLEKNIHFIAADLSQIEGAAKVIQEIKETYGGLDILINNLGGSETPGGGFEVLTDNHWQEIFNANLFASVRLDKGFLPFMLQKKAGVIIHIGSIQRTLPL